MAKKNEDTVRVEITASQIVHYRQTVSMTRDEWEQVKDQDGQECLGQHTSIITGWLDYRNIHDGGDFESISARVVDAKGKPVEGEMELEVN